jgi:hypothetical protein
MPVVKNHTIDGATFQRLVGGALRQEILNAGFEQVSSGSEKQLVVIIDVPFHNLTMIKNKDGSITFKTESTDAA